MVIFPFEIHYKIPFGKSQGKNKKKIIGKIIVDMVFQDDIINFKIGEATFLNHYRKE